MDSEIVNWLREGPSWLTFAVQKQLLGQDADARHAREDVAIARLTKRLADSSVGLPALKAGRISPEYPGNAHWFLFVLADIGFSARDLDLENDLEAILNRYSGGSGVFSLISSAASDYFCITPIPVAVMAMMGYRDHPAVNRFIQALWDARCPDGGWHCQEWDYAGTGCPMANLNVLMLLGQYPEYQNDPALAGALDLLLEHWRRRDEGWRKDDFGIGRRFCRLEYPAIKYGILRLFDVLSRFPYAAGSAPFANMLNYVRSKSERGKYFAETLSPDFADFDFGQKKEPSRWITFLVSRAEMNQERAQKRA